MSNESFAVAAMNSDDGCDESRCVSQGLNWLFKIPLTCYANENSMFRMACSHGYKPHFVHNEPVVNSGIIKLGTTTYPSMPFNYYTCCPMDLSPDVNVSRRCSNSILGVINNETTDVCKNDTTRPYPRKMANVGPVESYICCDSVSSNNKISFLNDTECVPFKNEIYSPTTVKNQYSIFNPISCDNLGIYKDFQYPTKVKDEEDNLYGSTFHYECCKTESTKLPIYIQDSAFKRTIYPQIVVSAIAVFLCMLLITALLIPLFLDLKKMKEQTTNANTNTSTNTRTNSNSRTNRRQQNTTIPTYGSYDLYLVYLAIPDLIMNISILFAFGATIIANLEVPYYVAWITYSLVMACTTSNLYINCIISYEILNLLRYSNNIARCRPPSLIKVTIQAMVVYVFSIIVFIVIFFLTKESFKGIETGSNNNKYEHLSKVNMIWSLIVSFALPIIFFCYVWITIWYRGYINMSSVTGAMKELCWYFFRIFVIFNLIWTPGMFLTIFGINMEYRNLTFVGYLFCGIQPTVSFCLAMMKTNVRKYVIDLLTFSYFRKAPETTPAAVEDDAVE